LLYASYLLTATVVGRYYKRPYGLTFSHFGIRIGDPAWNEDIIDADIVLTHFTNYMSALNREKKWEFAPAVAVGDKVAGGTVIGTVQETTAVLHKIMVPPNVSGVVEDIKSGSYTVTDTVCVIRTDSGDTRELTLMQMSKKLEFVYYELSIPARTKSILRLLIPEYVEQIRRGDATYYKLAN